jgi:hypothetical protein
MKMIAVGGVVVGPEHAVENAARAVAYVAQEQSIGAARAPIPAHAEAAAISERKARDVDRIRCCVRAAWSILAAVDVSAGIAAEVLDARHALIGIRASGGLQDVTLP